MIGGNKDMNEFEIKIIRYIKETNGMKPCKE